MRGLLPHLLWALALVLIGCLAKSAAPTTTSEPPKTCRDAVIYCGGAECPYPGQHLIVLPADGCEGNRCVCHCSQPNIADGGRP
jgi:hypothetical protein